MTPSAPEPWLKTRQQIETDETTCLAPYAQKAALSAGRHHNEPPHPYRTCFQRDRARVIHSRAFRRLEYKTQVFLNGTGDHLRTRLTHTIEVASVSRTAACALGLNEDLVEVIALAHDLGHSPFGHSGEEKLNELMRDHGGFEHNLQSLRIVEELELKYPKFPGLNLTYEVLEGLRKHDSGYQRPEFEGHEAEHFPRPSLEAQIANICDEITYYSHDLDDGLDHELIAVEQLEELEIWQICAGRVKQHFPHLDGKSLITYVIRSMIDHQVADLVANTARRVQEAGVQCADDVRRTTKQLAGYSADLRRANGQLRKFLYQNLYFHETVAEVNQLGSEMIEQIFLACLKDPKLMGEYPKSHPSDKPERIVCDYIAGMTDRYIRQLYEEMFG